MLKQLKYYTEVITCQSFTDAAEKCGISQSAMSQQIRALEENLDTELIRRGNRKFFMTPAGEYFYRRGLVLLDEAGRLKKETAQIGRQMNQCLRVGYLKYLHATELCRAAAILSEKYPAMELETAAGYAEELIDMLCFGGTDVILCSRRPGDLQDVEYIPLTKGRFFIEISERSPLCALDYVNVEELRRIPCIIATPDDQRERQRDDCVNMLGLQDNIIFADTPEEARLLAAWDKGFLLTEETGERPGQDDIPLRSIPLCANGKQLKRNYIACWRKDREDEYIREFAEILQKEYEKQNI
ncbi:MULTISPECIES: LysR family transcriptional regulator [Anaerostipes]|uniref:LysR family transcriptional regulator n=1 Tax=Anaerostipes hominis (ex Lee et al. 2021) TaxID=2025494 RepID=A0ABV4DEF5_9FIRM|nr:MULTISPECIES: LysR family transcriptional regulator [Anaerostipes]